MKKFVLVVMSLLMMPYSMLSQTVEGIDEIAPFSEGLAGVRKGDQWGFIDENGSMVIDLRDDIYWNKNYQKSDRGINAVRYPKFKDGLCIIHKIVDDISMYGFIDAKGNVVLEPQFLNVAPFKKGYTTGVLVEKIFRGKNEFNLNIYEHKFHDVLVNSKGEIVEYFGQRYNIHLSPRRYKIPPIHVKMLSPTLVAHRASDKSWKVHKVEL